MKEKNLKRANLLIKIILTLVILVVVAVIGIVLYDIIGLHYGFEQIKDHLINIFSRAYVWITVNGALVLSVISWVIVKVASIMENSTKYLDKVEKVNLKMDSVSKAFVETVSTINSKYSEKQSIFEEREVLMGEQINLLLGVIYDPEVISKVKAIGTQIDELSAKAKKVDEEINDLSVGG